MFQKPKRSKEIEGNSITDKNMRSTHPEYQDGIYDILGFQNESTVIKVKDLLEKYNKIILSKKINLKLYFLIYKNRLILDIEKLF